MGGDDELEAREGAATSTITAALARICSGGTISVTPGTYDERLAIGKDVTIRGIGIAPAVIANVGAELPGQPALVTVTGAVDVRLEGLSLAPRFIDGVLGVTAAAGAATVAIVDTEVTGGRIGIYGTFHRLTVTGTALSGAALHCVSAFSDQRPGSTAAFGTSSATGCGSSGFRATNFGVASFSDLFAGPTPEGIVSLDNARISIRDSVTMNTRHGFWIRGASSGAVRNNSSSSSRVTSFLVQDTANVRFEGNDALSSLDRGIAISGARGLDLVDNFVFHPGGAGLSVHDSDDIDTVTNVIRRATPGVYVQGSRDVVMVGDAITQGTRAGVELREVSGFQAYLLDIDTIAGVPVVDPTGGDADLGDFGHGVIVEHTGASGAFFAGCRLRNLRLAGIAGFNTFRPGQPQLATRVVTSGVQVACAAYAFDTESEPGTPDTTVEGTAFCRDCDGVPFECTAVSLDLEPPDALPQLQSSDAP